ncbi:hypothetical protein CDN98_09490 [Roseateles terrae]|nr:hypothetical protein CDN98_09490 [Roseateles terrae]
MCGIHVRNGIGNQLDDLDDVFTEQLNDEGHHPVPVRACSKQLPQAFLTDITIAMPGAETQRECADLPLRFLED